MGTEDGDRGSPEAVEPMERFGTRMGDRENPLLRASEWVLVEGDRLLIAGLLSGLVFVGLLALGAGGVIGFVNDDSITRLAGGMIAGTFSLVTLVVSINQLILSREFVAAGKAHDELNDVLSFRDAVADAADVPASPASPTGLLELLVATIHHRADELAAAVADGGHDDEVVAAVSRYVERVSASTERLDDTLEQTQLGTFGALAAAIRYDDPWQLYVARHLRRRHERQLSDEAATAFEGLVEALKRFGVAREHFKTTYLERELTRFSQLTIYTGLPAALSAVVLGLVYADLTGAALAIPYLPYVVSGLVAVVVTPMTLLASYILRTATVTRRTVSIGPMLPRKDPEVGPFDRTYRDDAGSGGDVSTGSGAVETTGSGDDDPTESGAVETTGSDVRGSTGSGGDVGDAEAGARNDAQWWSPPSVTADRG